MLPSFISVISQINQKVVRQKKVNLPVFYNIIKHNNGMGGYNYLHAHKILLQTTLDDLALKCKNLSNWTSFLTPTEEKMLPVLKG